MAFSAKGVNRFTGNISCSCDLFPRVVDVLGFELCNAPLIGTWLLALLFGVMTAQLMSKLSPSVTGYVSYSISFYAYPVMITSGFIVHCVYHVECGTEKPTPLYLLTAKLDGSLTSCIAISFLFNGLVDLQWIAERSWMTLLAMFLSYACIFVAYFHLDAFMYIYRYSVTIGCGAYILLQCVRIVKDSYWTQSLFLLTASAIGGVSFFLIMYRYCWLACQLGPWSMEFIWYSGSDWSIICILLYFWYTRTEVSQQQWKDSQQPWKDPQLTCKTIPAPVESVH